MNTTQVLSDEQKLLAEKEFKYPPNPSLLSSPYPWSSSYTSPAWGGANQVGEGFGLNPNYFTQKSDQFNSSVTQPLGMPQAHLNSQLGGFYPVMHKLGQDGGMYNADNRNEYPDWQLFKKAPGLKQMVPRTGKPLSGGARKRRKRKARK